ncbi:MAG: hypothetical protein ACR2GK_02295 [Gemmatimonadaceae bacterium]
MTEQPEDYRTIRFVGVGCVTAVAGLFSGGMMGVMAAKIIGGVRRCEAPTGLPACDWHVYAGIGMLIGVITLPVLALNRLRRSERATGERD